MWGEVGREEENGILAEVKWEGDYHSWLLTVLDGMIVAYELERCLTRLATFVPANLCSKEFLGLSS